jgi:hypothetical protein
MFIAQSTRGPHELNSGFAGPDPFKPQASDSAAKPAAIPIRR